MFTRSIVLAAAAFVLVACGDSPQPKAPDTAPSAVPSAAPAGSGAAVTPAGGKTYKLVISFISKGAGIDSKAKDDFGLILNKWRIEKGAELKTSRPKWGKEGEQDICADLAELSDADRGKFMDQVKTSLGKNDRVTISENAPCHADNK